MNAHAGGLIGADALRPALSSRRRWALFALLMVAGILNYVDRQIFAVLQEPISRDLKLTTNQYADLAGAFLWSSAIAFLFVGWIIDRIGIRRSNPLGVAAWSVAALAHGWAASFGGFFAARMALGATEAMGTPNQIKTVATLFPPTLRSLGFGLGNMVGSLGAIVTPVVVPAFALLYGWRAAFVVAGALGLAWTLGWLVATRDTDLTGAAEDPALARAPVSIATTLAGIGVILRDRRTWAISVAKVLSDSTWWFLLFWMPKFLQNQYGLKLSQIGLPLAIAYSGAAIGSLVAGSASSWLLSRGWSVNRVRKTAMLVSALIVLPVPVVLAMTDYWLVAVVLAVALAGHQGFSTNLFALIADITPTPRVARVTSVAAFCGNVGGFGVQKAAGWVLTAGLGYGPLFAFAAVSYLLALGWIQLLLPHIRTADGARPAVAIHH